MPPYKPGYNRSKDIPHLKIIDIFYVNEKLKNNTTKLDIENKKNIALSVNRN